jgi:gluconolactonase
MKTIRTLSLLALFLLLLKLVIAQTAETYPTNPDSQPQPGVPRGELLKFTFDRSGIFPGTRREYWVYVPAQYTPDRPACVYVNQDGVQYEAPTVFDNLIFKKEMPVTIGVFVMHGRVRAANPNSALDRFNRSYEYDGLGDNYVRFLLEELLPEVETKKTSDGRQIRLSKSGNDRAIGGSSSGAICAFTAAWERPGEFTRVFSAIGTFVGLRGGDRYPTLIRKFEPKAIRIFMQDGSGDLNIYGGDWWMANQTLERALTFAGYEVQHVWGEGGHNQKHATSVFPDAMRWLWKGWPAPVGRGNSRNQTLSDILIDGEDWRLVGDGYGSTQAPATDSKGQVVFVDATNGKSYKTTVDGAEYYKTRSGTVRAQAFDAAGRLISLRSSEPSVSVSDTRGREVPVAHGITGRDLVVGHNGDLYITSPPAERGVSPSKVWLIKSNGLPKVVDTGLGSATGIALSPDQTLLYVADARSHWVYSFQVGQGGTLQFKQRYYWLHEPDSTEASGAGGMVVDRDGRLYVATSVGIQICDQAGRVNAILTTPNGKVTSLAFGGPSLDTLFAMAGDKVYRRKLKVVGAPSWAAPAKPTPPRL